MTNRTRATRLVQAAAIVAVAALALAPLPLRGATSVEIGARALLGGRYEAGGWLAIVVTLVNDGAPTSGYVSTSSPDGAVRRFVELPAGSNKAVTLYLRPQAFARTVAVRFEAPEGSTTTQVEARAFERSSSQVAIVGDGPGNLRAQLVAAAGEQLPEPIGVDVAGIPERPEPLDGLAAIVWAADSSGLTELQRRSLERWVADGGQLVVVGGPDWQSRTASLADLLPVESLAAVDGVALDGLATWTGGSVPDADTTAATGTLRDGATALITDATSGAPLLAFSGHGAGRVIYSGLDLATAPYRGWEGAPVFWSRLLQSNEAVQQVFGGGMPIEEDAANAISSALSNLPSLAVPPAELLLAVIVGYILIIGPVSYLVLRRLDRRELAWVTAPLLIVVFTACSYGIGTSIKGSQVIVNEISLVRMAAGGTTAAIETYAGLFSPTRTTYDLTVEADALLAPLNAQAFIPAGGDQQETSYVTELGDPAHLRGVAIGVFGFQGVRADGIGEHQPALEVSWSLADSDITGTVTNTGAEPMEDVAVIAPFGGKMVGDLEPGASEDFTLSTNNFNGSPASDQVYGFGGFDGTSPAQREVLMRRQVIDSLVGYGQFFPGQGVDFGIGADRGPFVIGWQATPGPMPVIVDGHEVERYSHTVEVISGRPTLGPGEVRLAPSEMAISILSSDGNVTVEPGWVSLGAGEVVFGISLPLEAAGLEATGVRIVTGGDPSMVFMEQGGGGGFGGFMPAGYTLSVRDPRSGEWVELGDLSQQSTYEIDDPGAALSAAGRIEVRVVGREIDPNFGMPSIFVGASVSGVLAP
jgi:hypothetical protein